MKNQITFTGGLALVAMSLMFLTSCKKEQINFKKPLVEQSESKDGEINYKFSAVAKIPGENAENGFLSVKVSSNDEAFLKKYVSKLEKTKIAFVEADPNKPEEMTPLFEDEAGAVKIDFDWNNYNKHLEKGKLYSICIKEASAAKSLVVHSTFSNLTAFSTTNGYACVNLVNTYSKWYLECTCRPQVNWQFKNAANTQFYSQATSHGSNFEIRTFLGSSTSSWNFSVGGTTVYYQPRYNFSGTLITGTLTDHNGIFSGSNYLQHFYYTDGTANATFYIAG